MGSCTAPRSGCTSAREPGARSGARSPPASVGDVRRSPGGPAGGTRTASGGRGGSSRVGALSADRRRGLRTRVPGVPEGAVRLTLCPGRREIPGARPGADRRGRAGLAGPAWLAAVPSTGSSAPEAPGHPLWEAPPWDVDPGARQTGLAPDGARRLLRTEGRRPTGHMPLGPRCRGRPSRAPADSARPFHVEGGVPRMSARSKAGLLWQVPVLTPVPPPARPPVRTSVARGQRGRCLRRGPCCRAASCQLPGGGAQRSPTGGRTPPPEGRRVHGERRGPGRRPSRVGEAETVTGAGVVTAAGTEVWRARGAAGPRAHGVGGSV